jgi:formate dehydrogenase maturation protein FdhE
MSSPDRCPHCHSREIQPMVQTAYTHDRGVLWYRCRHCRRMWADETPLQAPARVRDKSPDTN